MTVTDIAEYKKGKYKIFLNDEFAFVLYDSDLKDHPLKIGDVLSDDVYDGIIDNILKKRCRAYALHILKKQDKSVKELRAKLSEALYPQVVIEDAISYVLSLHYADDIRYAENYIRSVSDRAAIFEIKNRLLSKGVSADDIETAMDNCRDAGIISMDTNLELLKKLMQKKLGHSQEEIDEKTKIRIFSSLYRKGFKLNDIERVYDELKG
ncbi:MAG: RecX family transcriptional regulator [Lachnospiraceae bacterium]|nr:RecX family transcriptional regulator [Lachnospiraceae bacterium]